MLALFLTGVPNAGKTTLGAYLTKQLNAWQGPTSFLDADVVRKQWWPGLGLSAQDRQQNVVSLGMIASAILMARTNVVVACIAPYRETRNAVLDMLRCDGDNDVLQVCLTANVDALRSSQRDGVKRLYARYDLGEVVGLTGMDAIYEPPEPHEAAFIDTTNLSLDETADCVWEDLAKVILHNTQN